MPAIARLSLVAIDCPDPAVLAAFYAAVTGWEIVLSEHTDWVQLRSDVGATIAFQQVNEYVAPVWPGHHHPQQMHLDFDVSDLDAGERAVLDIGARKATLQPDPSFRVFLDPAGHPFCLVLADR